MARRRRPGPRTSVADGRAEIIIPLETVVDPDGNALTLRTVSKWLRRVDSFPSALAAADTTVAVVLDRFAWDLHLGDVGHATDTHDGESFFEAAISSGAVSVYVVSELDPRRSKPEEIGAAATAGRLVGGLVAAFGVDVLES